MNKLNTILLVDDDSITNFLNENLLQELNISSEVYVANDGFKGLKFIRENWLEQNINGKKLVLLDINMPLMSGFEFLEHFEKLNLNDVDVVLLTTSSNDKDLARAKEFNVTDYITKPLTESKLMMLVENLKKIEKT